MTYRVIPMSSGEFDVQIDAVNGVRNHRVSVGPELLTELAVHESEARRVATAAIEHMDEHRELASLPAFVDLSRYGRRAGFVRDIRHRLAS